MKNHIWIYMFAFFIETFIGKSERSEEHIGLYNVKRGFLPILCFPPVIALQRETLKNLRSWHIGFYACIEN